MTQQNTSSDREFIEYLYENYYKLLRIKIYEMTKDQSLVGDLINEVFIKLIKRIDLLRSLECHKRTSYIVYTVRSVCIDYLRKQNRQSQHSFLGGEDDVAESIVDIAPGMEEISATQEELKATLSQLSERDRELLLYKYILDLPPKEIADIMSINHNHIWKYLARARQRAYKILTTKEGNN